MPFTVLMCECKKLSKCNSGAAQHSLFSVRQPTYQRKTPSLRHHLLIYTNARPLAAHSTNYLLTLVSSPSTPSQSNDHPLKGYYLYSASY